MCMIIFILTKIAFSLTPNAYFLYKSYGTRAGIALKCFYLCNKLAVFGVRERKNIQLEAASYILFSSDSKTWAHLPLTYLKNLPGEKLQRLVISLHLIYQKVPVIGRFNPIKVGKRIHNLFSSLQIDHRRYLNNVFSLYNGF